MAFWTDGVSRGTKEPKRNFRFKVSIASMDDSGMVWWAKSVTKPSYEITESEHTFLTHKTYYPGRLSWNEIELVLVDPISPGAVGLLNRLIRDQGYVVPDKQATAMTHHKMLETMSKGKGASALQLVEIQQLDSFGGVLERWELANAWVKGVNYGDLSYDNDDLMEVTLTMRYDYAICEIMGDDEAANNRTSFEYGNYRLGGVATPLPTEPSDDST